jgi:tetratricopeptide (TPR) repeat protein
LYREIIEDPARDNWTAQARNALVYSFNNSWSGQPGEPAAKARWFETALVQTTNSSIAEFYRQQAGSAKDAVSRTQPETEAAAETNLLKTIENQQNILDGKPGIPGMPNSTFYWMQQYVEFYNGDQALAARRLAEFLPKMESQFPKLAPFLAGSVISFQVETNTPVIEEFQNMLLQINQHPKDLFGAYAFWNEIVPMVRNWSMVHKQFGLAAQVLEAKLHAEGTYDFPEHYTNDMPYRDKFSLAYAYMALKRYQESLMLFESITNTVIRTARADPWGSIAHPGEYANVCREKLGLPSKRDPRQFVIQDGLFCLCSPSAFALDDRGIWIAIENRLFHLGFDLKTNVLVTLPKNSDTAITSIAIGGSNIWVGTDGEGLIHFDKTTRLCTRIMQQDGMLMNNIGCLHLSGNTLWIGYGHGLYMLNGERMGSAGGLGRLDLATGKFSSFTPSLAQDPTSANGPPRVSVIGIAESPTGDIWFVPDDGHYGLHRHTKQSDKWEVVFGGSCDCLAANATTLFTAHGRGWNFMLDKKASVMWP